MTLTKLESCEHFLRRACCLFTSKPKPAERYLSIGILVRDGLRQGFSLQVIAVAITLPISECVWALKYSEGSASLKFQALVEDWSWAKIVRAVSDESGDNGIVPSTTNRVPRRMRRSIKPQRRLSSERQRRLFGRNFEI